MRNTTANGSYTKNESPQNSSDRIAFTVWVSRLRLIKRNCFVIDQSGIRNRNCQFRIALGFFLALSFSSFTALFHSSFSPACFEQDGRRITQLVCTWLVVWHRDIAFRSLCLCFVNCFCMTLSESADHVTTLAWILGYLRICVVILQKLTVSLY